MKCPHCGKDIPDDYGEEEESKLFFPKYTTIANQLILEGNP